MDFKPRLNPVRFKTGGIKKNIVIGCAVMLIALGLAISVISGSRGNSKKIQGQVLGAQDARPSNVFVPTAYAQAEELKDDDASEHKPFEYEVQSGDTLSGIAERYNLKLSTILWANDLTAGSVIRPKQIIRLLPVDGVLHTVEQGDTIGQIALEHQGNTQEILTYNQILQPTKIHSGDMLIVPNGQPSQQTRQQKSPVSKNIGASTKEDDPPAPATGDLSGKLLWPTSAKTVTQKYSSSHRGIDISNGGKPEVFASHNGVVEFAGASGEWGNTVLIRGDDGLETRYSHNSEIYVSAGKKVTAGMTIAKVGNTGRVRGKTGLHLDFRVYKNGVAINPFNALNN